MPPIFFSAPSRPSVCRVNCTADASANHSRCRDTAALIRFAKNTPTNPSAVIANATATIGRAPLLSPPRPPNCRNRSPIIPTNRIPASSPISRMLSRMSPLRMWLNSCPMTPCNSSRLSWASAPPVTVMAASAGVKPAAKALMPGSCGITNRRGAGTPEASAISSTMLTNRLSCGSVVVGSTGTAPRDAATAAPPCRSESILKNMRPPMSSRVTAVTTTTTPRIADSSKCLKAIAIATAPSMPATNATTATTKRNTSFSVVPLAARWWSKKFMTADGSELDLRRVPHLGVLRRYFEEHRRGEVEHSRVDAAGERLAAVVVVHHGVVVGLPGERDLVLRRGQFLGQLHHGLVRLQIWVLLGDGDEPSQCAVELLLACRELLHRRGVTQVVLNGRQPVHRVVARRHNGFECLPLVRHVRLGRLDQVGNEVETAPQLDVDLREGVLVRIPRADQAVVTRDHEDDEQYDDDHGDDDSDDGPHEAHPQAVHRLVQLAEAYPSASPCVRFAEASFEPPPERPKPPLRGTVNFEPCTPSSSSTSPPRRHRTRSSS